MITVILKLYKIHLPKLRYKNVYENPSIDLAINDLVFVSDGEKQNILQFKDVLFTGSSETPNECGMSSVITEIPKESYYLNSFCFGFRLNDTSLFNEQFLKHYFRSSAFRSDIGKTANGVTRFNISKVKFGQLQIPILPLPIQQHIVEVLDTFTDAIGNLEEELALREKQFEYYREQLLAFDDDETSLGKKLYQDEFDYVALDSILDYEQPSKYIVKNKQYNYLYSIPVLTAGKSFLLGYTDEVDGIYEASKVKPTIIFDDFTTSFHWVDFPCKVKSSALKFIRPKNNDNVSFRYVYYQMCNINFVAKEHARHWISVYSKFEIPLPSLATQQHIVEILDTFEAMIANIKEEIALRTKQYEYYREKLLSFGN